MISEGEDQMTKKFDLGAVVNKVQASIKDKKRAGKIRTGDQMRELSTNPENYVVMPEWFQESFGVMGLPLGKIIQIAGRSDSGKTSLCIEAMRAAQEQGWAILYVETEGKTQPSDLKAWGVDPSQVMLVQSSMTEEAFASAFELLEGFYANYPGERVLFIFDSFGNTVSNRDKNLDMTSDAIQPGGKAKSNRLGINRLIAMMEEEKMTSLIVNYTYSNIGSVGRTNAGGEALGFFSALILQTARIGWVEGHVNKEKVKKGAKARWTVFKNHFTKGVVDEEGNEKFFPKSIDVSITSEGIKRIG